MKIFNDRKGVSAIAALFVLLSLAAMGTVIAYLVASGEISRANHLLSTKAFYVVQTGIEYGIKRIYDGQNEIVNPPGISFGQGSFTISRIGRTLTVTGTVGNTVRVQKVDSPTEADCTLIDTSNADLVGADKEIKHISFRKICLVQTTIDKMQLSWVANGGQRLKEIKIEDVKVYDNPAGAPFGTLIDIADYVMLNGNNNNINHIKFNQSIEGVIMTMTWTFRDNSTKTVTFGPLD